MVKSTPPPARLGNAPVYDLFGYPVGIAFPYLGMDSLYKADFSLELEEYTGIWCSGEDNGRVVKVYIHAEALPYFQQMQTDAAIAGFTLEICSAYRGYNYQQKVQDVFPEKAANPGFSEHHLGTALDLYQVYWDSPVYKWLAENAHHYGFVLSYYRGHEMDGLPEEANHWRFIGIPAAKTYFDLFNLYY